MLFIPRVINIFQKDPNLIFFATYFYKINNLPLTWDRYVQNFINFHVLL